jgi:putative acetyltransferase
MAMADIVHLRLSRDHASAAGAIHRRAVATIPGYPVDLHSAEDFTAFYRDTVLTECSVWGAFEDGLLQGHIAIRPGWIDHLYVDPDAHGRQIGTGLLTLAKAQQTELRLRTFQANAGARHFYERHGFEIESMTDGDANEEKMPDICYVWRR